MIVRAVEKYKVGEGDRNRRGWIFNEMVIENLPKKVAFEQRPRGEEASYMDTCGKSFLGRETSRCRGPEIEVCLAYLKKRKNAHVLEQSKQEGSSW